MKTNMPIFSCCLVFVCICLLLKTFLLLSCIRYVYVRVCACACSPQGIKHSDHFGFICRDQIESGPSQYVCFVFQCASESLVSPTTPVNEKNSFSFEPGEPFCACVCCHICVRQVDEVMLTLKQAFSTAAALQSNKTEIQLCEACPMHDLHKLCERIEGDCHPGELVFGVNHKPVDAWGASGAYSLFCLQVSTPPEQS